jgi:phosphoglucomutase
MGLDRTGAKIDVAGAIPSFGAVAAGDGDRNMILGTQFFLAASLDPSEPRLDGRTAGR